MAGRVAWRRPLVQPDLTQMLQEISRGDREAVDRMLPAIYDEIRRLARHHLRRERSDHTLQATALVHEAYLRLVDQKRVKWQNRAHFFAVASTAIRRILVDHARRHGAAARGGGRLRIPLNDADLPMAVTADLDLLALNSVLEELARQRPDHARVVELRFFGGLTVAETAVVEGISERTVERYWRFSRAWLFRRLAD